jgi:hypothetical protein
MRREAPNRVTLEPVVRSQYLDLEKANFHFRRSVASIAASGKNLVSRINETHATVTRIIHGTTTIKIMMVLANETTMIERHILRESGVGIPINGEMSG